MSNSNGFFACEPQEKRAPVSIHNVPIVVGPRPRFWFIEAQGTITSSLLIATLLLLAGCVSSQDKAAPPQPASGHQESTGASVKPAEPPAPAAPTPDVVKEASAKSSEPFEGEGWQDMFDGQTLAGWSETPFAGRGEVLCRDGVILLKMGDPFTGIGWTNELPHTNYEVAFDAMRIMGSDFFCGLTVPVGDSFCSLIVGGWGGSLVGISSLNSLDASENETTKFMNFESRRWYRIRLRVTERRIQGWIDAEKLVDVDISDKKISLRPGDIELSKPFGLACWQTSSLFREIRMRRVTGPVGGSK